MTELEKLHRKVFEFYGTEKDEKLFRYQITKWVEQGKPVPILKLTWQLVIDKNKMSTKDVYIRERDGKKFIERDFLKWVRLASEEIEEKLNQKEVA